MTDQLKVIETLNLRLIPCELHHLEAFLLDREKLGRVLGVTVPANWPEFPETIPRVFELLKSDPLAVEWGYHLFVHREDRALVGEGGYKGRPDKDGMVEIGYAIVPEYRRRGYALEAARGLASHAFSHTEVSMVQAHTLPAGVASINVLRKLGMRFAGTAHDPDEGEVLRWMMERKDYTNQ
jgi:[ribosomal protein S5]-alanine N-acetyltransferase